MKYIAQLDGSYAAYDENSEAFKQLGALSKEQRPVFLDAKDSGVVAYFAAQTKVQEIAATLAKDKAEAVAIAVKVLKLSDEQAKALFG